MKGHSGEAFYQLRKAEQERRAIWYRRRYCVPQWRIGLVSMLFMAWFTWVLITNW